MCSTALTLTLVLMVSGPAMGQTLTYDNDDPDNEWNLDSTNENWTDGSGAAAFVDGADVRFTTQAENITLTDTVSPGSIYYAASPGDDELNTDGSSELSTSSGVLEIDIQSGLVEVNVNIVGPNDVIFNRSTENGGSVGTIDMTGNIENNAQISGGFDGTSTGTVNLTGQIGGTASVDSGILNVESGGSVVGATSVTGGLLNNESGGSLQGATTVSGTGVIEADGGDFGTIDVQTGGTLNVTDATDADVTVSGGQGNIDDDLTGTLDVTGGVADVNAEVSEATTVTGGTLNNEASGDLQGATTISGTGIVDAEGGDFSTVDVQTGGTLNVTAATDADVTVSGGQGNIDADLTGTLDVTGGVADVSAEVSEATTVTGGTLNNEIGGDLQGATTISGTGIVDAEGGAFDTVDVQAGGTLNVTAATTAADIAVSGGQLNNETGGSVSGPVTLSGTGVVNMNGGTFGTLNLDGGTLNINTAVTQNFLNDNGTNIRVNGLVGGVDPVPGETGSIIGTFDNTDGSLTTFTGATITGLVTNRTNGVLTSEGGTFQGGILVEAGAVNINEATTVGTALTPGFLTNQAGTVTLDGNLTGNIANTGAGTTTNNAQLTGNLTVSDGRFVQTGDVATTGVTGTVTVSGGTLEAAGGTFAQTVNATNGDVEVTGVTTADITNSGTGDVTITGTGNMTGDLRNTNANGTFDVQGRLNGQLIVTNGQGSVSGGVVEDTVTLDGGVLTVTGATARLADQVTVNDAELRANGGSFENGVLLNTDADMQVGGAVSGVVDNDAGDLTITGAGNLTGTIDQAGGTTDLTGQLTGNAFIAGGSMTARSGSNVNGQVNITGGNFIGNGGTITNGLNVTAGSADIIGTVNADATVGGGTLDVTGVLGGDVIGNSGIVTNTGTIANDLEVNGANVTQSAGQVTGQTRVTGGNLTASGGTFAGGLRATAGNVDVTGNISASSFVNDGGTIDVTTTGDLANTLTHESGTTNMQGEVGGLAISGSGLTTRAGSRVTGDTTVTAGTLVSEGGNFVGGIANTGGQVDIDGATTSDITNTTGQLNLNTGNVLTGDVGNADDMRLSGTLAGVLTNTGDVDARGAATSVINNSGGLFNVNDGRSMTIDNTFMNNDGATLALDGTLNADVMNSTDGVFDLDGGTLSGGFTNFGDMTSTGAVTVTGASRNEGSLTVATGNMTINDTFTNVSNNTLTIDDGATFTADRTVNVDTGRIVNNGTMAGVLENTGSVVATNATFEGRVENTGTISSANAGTLMFEDGLQNSGPVELSQNGTPTDNVMIGGAGLSGNGSFAVDIDLSNNTGGTANADVITLEAGAPVTGNVQFDFNVLGLGGQQRENVPVLQIDPNVNNDFTFSSTGLPDPGESIIYALIREDNGVGDLVVTDLLNPGIGALAGSIVLTQSLIGSVINRPSSPYVTGLAYEDENPCGSGGWERFTGGSADSNGLITQVGADQRAVESSISADFYGFQAGGDFACFNGYFDGWDLAAGGIAGFNEGQSQQPVFALDLAGNLSTRLTSVTTVDFHQTYAGIYGTAVKDRFAAELQYRIEQTDFTANNEGRNGSFGLGLNDSEFESDSSTFSGSLSYALNVPNTDMVFVPVAGFAYTQVETDPIVFADGSTVQVQDFDSRIGFVGGTLSRTNFSDDGTSALNQFATATYYKDFADDPASVFTSGDGLETRSVTTENLGAYTELSVGVNYVKILPTGNYVNAKQLSASARADWRVSDQLESWGVTAQVRIQF